MKSKMLRAAIIAALTLTACSDAQPTAQTAPPAEETDITAAEVSETTTAAPEIQEVSYMEKCKALIEELPPAEILEKRDGVDYPDFQKYTYFSQTAGRETPVNVLLPADYSENREYPVLYILHGYWDNEDWMTRDVVHISVMLNNLIADGQAEEMIVVCPYIFCSKELQYCTGMNTENTLCYDNFINDMFTDVMPFIESKFSVKKDRDHTAITGFSMGARESLFIAFSRPDLFGYIGSACTAPGLIKGTGEPHNLEKSDLVFPAGSEPHVLLLSASEKDGVVGTSPMTNTEHLWHKMSATGHDASSVTPHLYNFMRMIFRSGE